MSGIFELTIQHITSYMDERDKIIIRNATGTEDIYSGPVYDIEPELLDETVKQIYASAMDRGTICIDIAKYRL